MQLRTTRAILLLAAVTFGQAAVAKDRAPTPKGNVAPVPLDDLSSLLSASVETYKLPGLAAAIVEGDRLTALGAAGVRCRGQAERMTVDDLFHIGSDTKSMTATVVAMLVEEGKLRWTSTPAEILPKDGVRTIDPAWKRVTLEELLTHRAGVRANPDPAALLLIRAFSESPPAERRDVCRAVLRKPPDKEPGKAFLYSNTGYIIAGTMAETVTGKPWEALMRERLFRPLGMASAGYGPPGLAPSKTGKGAGARAGAESKTASTSSASQPCGHLPNGVPIAPSWAADNPACYGPAGTVHLSLRDWAKYASLHLAGERGTAVILPGASKPLLSLESLRRLHTPLGGPMGPGGSRYAMGWGVGKDAKTGENLLLHFGSNGMWLAGIALYPGRNVAVLVATNQGGEQAQKACSELLRTLAHRKVSR